MLSKQIKKYMSEIGKKGGSKSSPRKTMASRVSLARARAIRWQEQQKPGNPGKKKGNEL